MSAEMKTFKLYEEYRKIPFKKVIDIKKYIIQKLKRGHAIIQILVNEDGNSIDELISYANASEEESWYRCYMSYLKADQHLKDYVITEFLVPFYEEDGYVSIYNDCPDITTFNCATDSITEMKEYYEGKSFQRDNDKTNYHYEFYISKGKCDIENFGASMECHFAEAWHEEYGWIKTGK